MIFQFFLWFFFIFTILFGIEFGSVCGQCQRDQTDLLLQLRSSLEYETPSSTKLVKWNSTTDCCLWEGVKCDARGIGRVVGLDLSSEYINDGLDNSSSLFSLQYLQSLNLAFNNFNISLPGRFGNLTGLVYLNLSNAGFWGQIPVQLTQLRNLVSLDLSALYFPGVNPLKLENPNFGALVGNLTELTDLRLDGVNISADGSQWCRALSSSVPKLQNLSLSNCFLHGSIDPSLERLQSLSVIRLGGNNFSGPIPGSFANLSNLIELRLASCDLSGSFPEAIFQIPTLELVDVSYNRLLQGTLEEFHAGLSLQSLILSYTNFSGIIPESIGNLVKLRILDFSNCSFRGPIPKSIADLTQLLVLDLSANSLNGSIPSFQSSKNLTRINFSHNNLSGEMSSTHFDGLENLVEVDFRFNSLSGKIPSSLFAIPSLQKIQLSSNQFSGLVPGFRSAPSSLSTLDLSDNKLEGPIPVSFFNLQSLNVLVLSSNRLNGTMKLAMVQGLGNLTNLNLSYNNLMVEVSGNDSATSSYPKFSTLLLASCNLRVFPDLRQQTKLISLDLSDNQLSGFIPNWLWEVGNGSLLHLNLSHNLLVTLQQRYSIPPNLAILDIHHNQLEGNIPEVPPSASFVDYSSNAFTSSIPDDLVTNLSSAIFFSLSSNNLTGVIPRSFCDAAFLQVLDLSSNSLTGKIPSCLISRSTTLGVLNLRRNSLNGSIPDGFPSSCALQTLDLNRNCLQGTIPKSLSNCSALEVLDLGNNEISAVFPCLLKNLSNLRVLVLRNNSFHGSIGCPKNHGPWNMLQILDLAMNNFSGIVHAKCLTTWTAMMGNGNKHDRLTFEALFLSGLYYQDTITVTAKGLELKFEKILTFLTSIDFSCNNFTGQIPETLGQFTGLYILNMSHNAFTGQIPPALGKLQHLESLDLSSNLLTGEIPPQLVSLTFLSSLNVSNNQLVGKIPTGNQFSTFENTSFLGNAGLCGSPLTESCDEKTNSSIPKVEINQKNNMDWEFIIPGLGFGIGAGAIVAPLLFLKDIKELYNDRVDRILSSLLPLFGLVYYMRNDWRIQGDESTEKEFDEDEDEDEDETEAGDYVGRYCVFCTKIDITRKQIVHDPKCTCYNSPLFSPFSSSSFLSSDSS